MGGGGGGSNEKELDQTPTWAVSVVCLVIIMISILLEKLIHLFAAYLERKKKKPILEALEKIRKWKAWERETQNEQDQLNDPSRFRLTHETSFVREHTNFLMQNPITFYCVCFLRQFFRSVRRADYLTFRHGFVSVHLAPGSKFDFQKYIMRSLEDDFKVVVGISPLLWCSMLLFLLLDVHGWNTMVYVSILPLVVILAVGTKLQGVISKMAIEIKERHAVVQGIPLVQVSDQNFWFGKPQLVLRLIHFVLFQNAFEITYFFWIWYEFGLRSCFHSNFPLIIARVCLGVGVQILCSYITLPLYALVTQMGSTMKRSVFDEQTSKALKSWHKKAVKTTNDTHHTHHHTPTLGRPEYAPPEHKGGDSGNPPGSSANIMASVDIDGIEGHQQRDLLR
ncbi:hypothetical protein ACFE04_015623 [Oxalis oulophora]